MPRSATRRQLLTAAALLPAASLSAFGARAAESRTVGDIVLGEESAPLTVIEYASFTCPHCAAFHRDTFPEFRAAYIDTGKVRFILREVYFDPYGLWASLVARCGGEASFYPMADQFLKRQDEWSRAEDIAAAIQKIGRINGLSSEAMRECLTDQTFAEELVANYQQNATADGIQSTPSFIIGGDLHAGNMTFDEFAAIVDQALAG